MRRSRRVWILFSMLFGLDGILAGQAMVEYGAAAGRAGTTAAPARSMGKAIGGIMESLEKVLKTGHDSTESTTPAAASPTVTNRPASGQRATLAPPNTTPAVPAKIYEDPSGIRAGMANDDLVRRFGPPALEVSNASSRTLTYRGKSGVIQLEVRDDKVSMVAAASNPHQAALVLPGGPDRRP